MASVTSGEARLPPTTTPPAEVPITAQLIAALVADQFPQLAHLPLTHLNDGWDNTVYRLGEELLARIPRRQMAADIAVAEHVWLPQVGANWTFPVPVPVAVGEPGRGYPWHWAIVPWLPGAVAVKEPLSADGAADLGAALAQVHVPAPQGAPYNEWRSIPIAERTGRFAQRVEIALADHAWNFSGDGAYSAVAAADERGDLTWCHLDIHGKNVLTDAGRFTGLLDWGDSGAGDPCTDLGQSLTLVGLKNYQALASAYVAHGGAGDPHAPRVRAEAVLYAMTLATQDDADLYAAGWRALVDLALAKPAG